MHEAVRASRLSYRDHLIFHGTMYIFVTPVVQVSPRCKDQDQRRGDNLIPIIFVKRIHAIRMNIFLSSSLLEILIKL
jgi:hypothetical protein